jgi:hypothetical protein
MIELLNKERRRVREHTTPPVHPSLPLSEQTTNERRFAGYIGCNCEQAENNQHPKTKFVIHVFSMIFDLSLSSLDLRAYKDTPCP